MSHSRKRLLRRSSLIAALVAAAALGWVVWTALQVVSDVRAAQSASSRLMEAVAAGEQDDAQRALEAYSTASNGAASRTSGSTWSAVEVLPLVGDDANAVRVISEILVDLGEGAAQPLVEVGASLDEGTFSPVDGRFPIDDIAALQAPVASASDSLSRSQERLRKIDSAALLGPLEARYLQLDRDLDDALSRVRAADRAARLMPALLGAEGDREFLFVFQNNAEIRATGGIGGNVLLIRASDGAVEIGRQSAGGTSAFPQLDEPVLPLSPSEELLYGEALGTYFVDANFTADFPRASDLWRARWERTFDDKIDGIVSLDPVTLSYVMEGTGDIDVDGYRMTADNAVESVENLVYRNIGEPERQDQVLNRIAELAFEAVVSGRGDQVAVLRGLTRGIAEGRVRMHLFDPAEQEDIAGTPIAGELGEEGAAADDAGLFLNDSTGAKMSYYLDYQASLSATTCTEGDRQRLQGRFTVRSATPPDILELPETIIGDPELRQSTFIPPGHQLVVVDVMTPVAGELVELRLDGEPVTDPLFVDVYGRAVAPVGLLFEPGQSHELEWEMLTRPGQTGPVRLVVTPGVVPEDESTTAASAC